MGRAPPAAGGRPGRAQRVRGGRGPQVRRGGRAALRARPDPAAVAGRHRAGRVGRYLGLSQAADPNGEHWACLVRSQGEPAWIKLGGSGPGGSWTPDDDCLPRKVTAGLHARPIAMETLEDARRPTFRSASRSPRCASRPARRLAPRSEPDRAHIAQDGRRAGRGTAGDAAAGPAPLHGQLCAVGNDVHLAPRAAAA